MINLQLIQNEFIFKTGRSQGPGGQNVNKVNTRIELRFNIPGSTLLTESEKERLQEFYRSRITAAGDLLIISQESRSQLQNKELAVKRMLKLLEVAFIIPPKRIPTRPTRAALRQRLEQKKRISEKKRGRNKRNILDPD